MKVLYIYPQFAVKNSGGCVVSKRNFSLLCRYYGDKNVLSYPIHRDNNQSYLVMFLNDIISGGWGYTNEDKKKILDIIRSNKIGLVYVDTSLFGGIVRYIKKKTQVKTIVFFHNVEYTFVKGLVSKQINPLFYYRVLLAYTNEKKAMQYSDIVISLTRKDSEKLLDTYNRKTDYIIPVTFDNKPIAFSETRDYSEPLHLLFFGSNFPPNVEAVDILIHKILPKVNAKLTIAGNGMDKLLTRYTPSEKLTIRGFVDDIHELYNSSDIVVMPIISGSGMKVKTAEAMMFGKNIIATDNALEGYEVDGIPGILRCNSVIDFIESIQNFDRGLPRYNKEARNLFLTRYSDESAANIFKCIFDELSQ